MEKPERTEKDKSVGYYHRTYSLKEKDGKYVWFYDDGSERFPGITFSSQKEAIRYHDKIYGRTYAKFDRKR